MIQFLQNIFRKKNNKSTELINANSNRIEFIFDKNKEANIKISIVDTEIDDAQLLADLIHNIVSGGYTDNIMTILLSLSETDETIKKFVTQTLIYYSMYQTNFVYKDNSRDSNEPMIKPTEFQKQK